LQHPLGVAFHDGKLYVADTYNDAIKEIDLATRTCKTIAGTPPPAPPPIETSEEDLELPATDTESDDGEPAGDAEG
jgi:hypothetical protein